jgi:hypothetical protein
MLLSIPGVPGQPNPDVRGGDIDLVEVWRFLWGSNGFGAGTGADARQCPARCQFRPKRVIFCTAREVVDAFSARFSGKPGWQHDAGVNPKEAAALTLSSALAHSSLQWHPQLDLRESLAWTADWVSFALQSISEYGSD